MNPTEKKKQFPGQKKICVTNDEGHDFPASINDFLLILNIFFNRINRRDRATVHGGGRILLVIRRLNFKSLFFHFVALSNLLLQKRKEIVVNFVVSLSSCVFCFVSEANDDCFLHLRGVSIYSGKKKEDGGAVGI